MNAKAEESQVETRFKRVQTETILLFTASIFVVTIFLSTVLMQSSERIMRERVRSLVALNSGQLQVNISAYLDKVETTAALFFSEETDYRYDATDPTLDDYTSVKSEEEILNRIVDLGVMENFADFGVVYANDHTVGWISRGTDEMFPSGGMYDTFAALITDTLQNDAWAFGVNGNKDRIYYVKRVNENAVLITSFYNRELDSAIRYTQELQDLMTIRLVDENDVILFSSAKNEIGTMLPEDIGLRLLAVESSNQTTIDNTYLISTNACENGWRVICTSETNVLLQDSSRLRTSVVLFAGGACILLVIIGLLILEQITKPMDGMVSKLAVKADVDQLAGVLNKSTFQDKVERRITTRMADRCLVFVMLDADNFKQVNDRLGHAYGDNVIVRIGGVLKRIFDDDVLVGRIGGDEFAICMEMTHCSKADAIQRAVNYMDKVYRTYSEEFREEHKICGLSLSAGLYVQTDASDMSFETIYKRTDTALYYSKRGGKNRYTLYREDMDDAAAQ